MPAAGERRRPRSRLVERQAVALGLLAPSRSDLEEIRPETIVTRLDVSFGYPLR